MTPQPAMVKTIRLARHLAPTLLSCSARCRHSGHPRAPHDQPRPSPSLNVASCMFLRSWEHPFKTHPGSDRSLLTPRRLLALPLKFESTFLHDSPWPPL